MSDFLTSLSDAVATAVDRAAAGVVQISGYRRPAAGIVFAPDLVLAPARALENDTASVRVNGATHEGVVLGRAFSLGLAVIRTTGLGVEPLQTAPEPRVGHLAVAVGRTWSGGVIASVTNVAVIGGPLRTGRTSQLERVLRIAQAPHGAFVGGALVDGQARVLGVITGNDIRGTTVVIPSALAWPIGQQIVTQGGTKQGFLGVSSMTVRLPERYRTAATQRFGLLVTSVVEGGPADSAGVLIGDVITALDGQPTEEPETLVMMLRTERATSDATLTVVRAGDTRTLPVKIGERPLRGSRESSGR